MATQTRARQILYFSVRGFAGMDPQDITDFFDSVLFANESPTTVASVTGTASPFPIAGLASTQGGAVTVTGGASSTGGNAGGAVTLLGGAGGLSGAGGAINATGAAGGGTTGVGGAVVLAGGAGTNGNSAGGLVSLTGGAGQGSAIGGVASLVGGAGGATGAGAAVSVTGGAGGSGSGVGGAVNVTGGVGTAGNSAGGAVTVIGGAGQGSAAGGAGSVKGGLAGATGIGGAASVVAGAGGSASGKGGAANVTAGAGTAGNADGGSVVVTPGAKNGSGLDGGVFLRSTTLFRKIAAPGAGADQAEVLTAAGMINTIFVHTISTGRTLTTPTGAAISAGCPTDLAVGDSFLFHVITVGTGADDIVTLTAGDGNVTFIGKVTIGPDTASIAGYATFIFRNSGASTWVGYRVG